MGDHEWLVGIALHRERYSGPPAAMYLTPFKSTVAPPFRSTRTIPFPKCGAPQKSRGHFRPRVPASFVAIGTLIHDQTMTRGSRHFFAVGGCMAPREASEPALFGADDEEDGG
jgi:hypothetical protein